MITAAMTTRQATEIPRQETKWFRRLHKSENFYILESVAKFVHLKRRRIALRNNERKLNYIEVEIVPSSREEAKRDPGIIHITDGSSVKYSTIIFPNKDNGSNIFFEQPPRSSLSEHMLVVTPPPSGTLSPKPSDKHSKSTDSLQSVGGDVSNSTESCLQELHISSEEKVLISPPRRRRALSSPSPGIEIEVNENSSIPSFQDKEQKDIKKTRTLPAKEKLWEEDILGKLEEDDGLFDVEKGATHEKIEFHKREKMYMKRSETKKASRASSRHVSDLGSTQELLQAVQAMQKRERRRSSGGSIDSFSDAGYSSVSQLTPASSNADLMGLSPTHVFHMDPLSAGSIKSIPGSKRSTELERAFARRKLSRQKSTDHDLLPPSPVKKTFDFSFQSLSPETTKPKSKLLQMFPAVRFGKSHPKVQVEEEQSLMSSLQAKKPVPLPRYNRSRHLSGDNKPEPPPCMTQKVPLASIHGTGSIDEGPIPCPGHHHDNEPYMNMMFTHKEECHSYENVNLDQRVPDIMKTKSHDCKSEGGFLDHEECHHSRPMPAPRAREQHPLYHADLFRKETNLSHKQKGIKSHNHGERHHHGEQYHYNDKHHNSSGHATSFHSSRDLKHRTQVRLDIKESNKDRHSDYPVSCSRKLESGESIGAEKSFYSIPTKHTKEACHHSRGSPEGSPRRAHEGRSRSEYAMESNHTPKCHRQKHVRSQSGGGNEVLYACVMKTHMSPKKDEPHVGHFELSTKCEGIEALSGEKSERRAHKKTHDQISLGSSPTSSKHGSEMDFLNEISFNDSAGLSHGKTTWFVESLNTEKSQKGCSREAKYRCDKQGNNGLTDCGEKSALKDNSFHQHQKPSYINQPWYYGKLLRQECEYLMLSKGSSRQYLVRDSSHRAGGLMLCVLYGQKVHHYIIQIVSQNQFQMAHHNYTSVEEIIEFYHKHVIMYSPSHEPVFLGEPFLYPR